MSSTATDRDLIQRIRNQDESAWQQCIAEYEGRLQAFVFSRLGNQSLAEDLVQETFLGFLTALPNYDSATPLESFLFAIASHKITDALRKQGRRPVLPLNAPDTGNPHAEPQSRARMASSLARSGERRDHEEKIVAQCLQTLIEQWMNRGEFERLKCAELLFVQGRSNQEAAQMLSISEQDVANHKSFIVSKLKAAVPPEMILRDL